MDGSKPVACELVQPGRSATPLPAGEAVELGRGWLGQQYTRCSRVHVELRYEAHAGHLLVTARGANPVVVEHAEGKKKVLLAKGEKATLRHAAALYFVPQDETTRFVVHVPADQKTDKEEAKSAGSSQESSGSQASWPEIGEMLPPQPRPPAAKKRKEPASPADDYETWPATTTTQTTKGTKKKEATTTTATKSKSKAKAKAKPNPANDGNDEDDDDEYDGSVQEPPKKRPRCKYGSECYRKSKGHKAQFSHSPAGSPSSSPRRQDEQEEDDDEVEGEAEEEEEEEVSEKKKKGKTKGKAASEGNKKASGGGSGGKLLAGKTVVLTGALSTRRTDMVRLLKQAGAKIGSGVSKNTDILVAGDKPGSKLTKAEALGVAVWQEEELLKALKNAGVDENAVGEGEAEDTTPSVQLLLANKWNPNTNPTGWWMSEKLDGVRAYWNGSHFVSRLGNKFEAPDWFLEGLPSSSMPLDGELWKGRGMFQSAVGIVKSKGKTDKWKELTFQVFDSPGMLTDPFEARVAAITRWFGKKGEDGVPYARVVAHTKCKGEDHLHAELARIEKKGGEGLMLRQPGSHYIGARSSTLLKVKTFHDAEARVIGHTKLAPVPGAVNKNKMKVGTLRCEMANGTQFSIGTGFSDYQRENPPPIGAIVSYRFQELTKDGIPRFPSYIGERADMTEPKDPDPSLMAGAKKDA